MPRPIDPERDLARARGDKRYFSARACPLGHFERWVISANCSICQLSKQKAKIAAKPKAPDKIKTPKPEKMVHRVSAKRHVERIKAAPRFNAKLQFELGEYNHSMAGRKRSAYLNNLINGIAPSKLSTDSPTRRIGHAFHQFKKVAR
jgi:hypothetical protein